MNPGLISPPFATSPVITGDGTISGYLKYPGCSGSACSNTSYVPVLRGATLPSSAAPAVNLQISRNGRYLADGNTVLDRNTGTLRASVGGFELLVGQIRVQPDYRVTVRAQGGVILHQKCFSLSLMSIR